MKKSSSGFTIVELLIVIVIIAILAAITIVAYNGIQGRARDNSRYADVKAIIKALELYKADNGTYPTTDVTAMANTPGCSIATGYSYSMATDDSWMKKLVTSNYISRVPRPSINDCSHYYQYLYIPKASATLYNCPSRTVGYYVLNVTGADGAFVPDDASSTATAQWKPCTGATVGWGGTSKNWSFARDDN